MPRPVYLLVFPAPSTKPEPAHWAFFVPNAKNPKRGKYINAVGTPFTGYAVKFMRNHDLEVEKTRYELIPLGAVPDEFVESAEYGGNDKYKCGGGHLEDEGPPVDGLEKEALEVPAPEVWKRPLDPDGGEHCQHWLKKYVARLVEKQMLSEEAAKKLGEVRVV